MYVCLLVAFRITCCLNQMFLHRRAHSVIIGMEEEQTFRQLSVVQSFLVQQGGNNCLVVSVGYQFVGGFAFLLQTSAGQFLEKSKMMDIGKELFFKFTHRCFMVSVEESKEILEHPAGCT